MCIHFVNAHIGFRQTEKRRPLLKYIFVSSLIDHRVEGNETDCWSMEQSQTGASMKEL